MIVNLHLTHKCNLRCTYCYTGDKTLGDMTSETLLDAFAFMEDRLEAEHINLVFFGGEPLVRFDLLRRAVLIGEQLPKQYYYKMSTNGTLLTQEIIDFCLAHSVYISLSLDGTQAASDLNRIYPNGRGSFRDSEAMIGPLLEAMPHSGLFMVVHPNNMRHLRASVEYMLDRSFRFINLALDYSADWTPADFKVLARSYVELGKLYAERTRRGDKFYLSLFDGRIQTRVQGVCEPSQRCAAGLHQLSIAPSGQIYPCVQYVREDRDEAKRIGHVLTGVTPEKRTEHAAVDGYPDEICDACFLKDRCSHWCRCVAYQTSGDSHQISPVFCAHEKMLFRIVDRMAGKLFSRKFPRFVHKHYNDEYPFLAAVEDLIDAASFEQGEAQHV